MTSLFIAAVSLALIIWILHVHSQKDGKRGAYAWLVEPNASQISKTEDPEEIEKKQDPVTKDTGEINRTYRIADMHFARGDFEEAERWFIKVLARNEDHTETLNRLGVIYIQQGNPRRAEILYQKLLGLTQKEPAYYCNYGRCLYNQGRLKEAIEAYENAVKLDSTKPSRFVSIGQVHYELKDYQKALAAFVRALELDPLNREFLSLTAELAQVTGDTERYHQSLKKLAEVNPYGEKPEMRI